MIYTILYKRFCRISSDKGLNPIVTLLLYSLLFFVGIKIIYTYIMFPDYVISLCGVSIVFYFSTAKRNDFLRQFFSDGKLKQFRLLENLLIILPFLIVLAISRSFILLCLCFMSSVFISSLKTTISNTISLPTPFYKFPFEFARGIRRFGFFILLLYFLNYFAIEVGNINLSVFFMLACYLAVGLIYTVIEPIYYVWIYNYTAKEFLIYKSKIIFRYSAILGIPFIVVSFIWFPEKPLLYVWILILGFLYIIGFMLAKYSSYPFELSVNSSIILAVSILFPPLLIITLPVFYLKAVKNLSEYLYD